MAANEQHIGRQAGRQARHESAVRVIPEDRTRHSFSEPLQCKPEEMSLNEIA
jgi:hypothetical protein